VAEDADEGGTVEGPESGGVAGRNLAGHTFHAALKTVIVAVTSSVALGIGFLVDSKSFLEGRGVIGILAIPALIVSLAGLLLVIRRARRWRRGWIVSMSALTACSTVVFAIQAALYLQDLNDRPLSPSIDSTAESAATSPGPNCAFGKADTFDGTAVDSTHWRLDDPLGISAVADGELTFTVPGGRDEEVEATMTSLPPGIPICELAVKWKVTERGQPTPHALQLVLRDEHRDQRITLGPAQDNPVVELWLCELPDCGEDYSDYRHPYVGLLVDELVESKVVWDGAGYKFFLNGTEMGRVVADQPLTEARLYVYADDGAGWTAALEDFSIRYAR
jgi:hypothetical protein